MEPKFSAKFAAFVSPQTVQQKTNVAPFPKGKAKPRPKGKQKQAKKKPTLFELAKNTCEAPQTVMPTQAVMPDQALRTTNELMAASAHKQESIASVQTSSSIQDLIRTMSDVIMIEQNNGISRCEIHLATLKADSPFKNGVLTLEHYDTHPHSFNIDLCVDYALGKSLFNDNIASLESHLKMVFPSFEFNVAKATFGTPSMAKGYAKKSKRKEETLMAKTTNKASLSDEG